MTIASCIDGRIRVRDGLLHNPAVADSLSRLLLETPGIREVSANPRAGSLLILYQQAKSSFGEITALLARFLPEQAATSAATSPAPAAKSRTGRSRRTTAAAVRRQAVNLGMLAALLVSLAGAALGAKALHIIAGFVFVGFFGLHFLDKKHFIFSFGG
jgi:hypothetical protein